MRTIFYARKQCRLQLLFTLVIMLACCPVVSAQMADWKPAGNTDFPTNRIWQINGICRISQFVFSPSDASRIWAVTAEGGLFNTTDKGLHWRSVPGTEHLTFSCAAVCEDRTNPSMLLLGTGDQDYYYNGAGVWRSTDGGNSFTAVGISGAVVLRILQDPVDPLQFTAATDRGIFKTNDAGLTWNIAVKTEIVGGIPVTTSLTAGFADMVKNAAPLSRTLYACTIDPVPVFYRSTDFGDNWEKITNGITANPIEQLAGGRLGVTAANPDRVYFFMHSGFGMLYVSDNGGLSFQLRKPEGPPNLTGYVYGNSTSSGQGHYNSAFHADNANADRIWYSAHNFAVSTDAGQSFVKLHDWWYGIHTDAKAIAQSPDNPGELWASNDGGIWISYDGGISWKPRSNGLYAYEIGFRAGTGSRTQKDMVHFGTQDNGGLLMEGGNTWSINAGDDYRVRDFDYQPDGGNMYFPRGASVREDPNSVWLRPVGVPVDIINEYAFNRKWPDLAFGGDNSDNSVVYRTENLSAGTPNWTTIATLSSKLEAIASPVANADRLYAITKDGRFYYSSNARSNAPAFNYTDLGAGTVYIATIATMPNNANKVYVAINEKILYSQDGGQTWQNITYNLVPVMQLRILAEEYGGTEELVFVASANAVYYKKAGQTSWTLYTSGLPTRRGASEFSMFDDSTGNARLRYASYGRGVFETPFSNLRPLKAIIDLSDSVAVTCAAPAVQMQEISNGKLHTPISYSWSFPGGNPATSTLAAPQVTYPASGDYTINLTIKDALGNQSTAAKNVYIYKLSCTPDTIPGRSLRIVPGRNFVSTEKIDLGTTNTTTYSAWLKTGKMHTEITSLLTANYFQPHGFILKTDNYIGFIWEGAYYNLPNGPQLPADNKWHHVAITTGPDHATVYLDGFPFTYTGLDLRPIELNTSWVMGKYVYLPDLTFEGQMDEVCLYNRELSTAEIREQMNLTKNQHAVDPSLKAYYQFNDYGRLIYNRAGSGSAKMIGTVAFDKSTAPVGGGAAQTIAITAAGEANFAAAGISFNFPAGSVYPNGPVVATRLNIAPDKTVSTFGLPYPDRNYWIVRSYGSNAIYTPPASITFAGVKGTTTDLVSNPAIVKLHTRPANEEGSTWGNPVAAGSAATDNSGTGSVTFATGLGTTAFSQLLLESPSLFRLVSFTGVKENNSSALLQWNVKGEAGIVSYELQRSINGGSFSAIGIVQAAGLGNYQFRDLHPAFGTNTYRLLIKDITGATSYSNEVVLEFIRPALQVVLSPVPATQTLELRMNQPLEAPLSLQLFNSAGQLVAKEMIPAGAVTHTITLTRYSAGLYTIALREESGKLLFKEQFSKVNR